MTERSNKWLLEKSFKEKWKSPLYIAIVVICVALKGIKLLTTFEEESPSYASK
jgi:hypothetical protein